MRNAAGLPKTRSGKIMRRVLRKIAAHEESELGDTSTLAVCILKSESKYNEVAWDSVRISICGLYCSCVEVAFGETCKPARAESHSFKP